MIRLITISHAMMERFPERKEPERHSIRLNDGTVSRGSSFAETLAAAIAGSDARELCRERDRRKTRT